MSADEHHAGREVGEQGGVGRLVAGEAADGELCEGADGTPDEDAGGWVGVGDGGDDAVEEGFFLLGLPPSSHRLHRHPHSRTQCSPHHLLHPASHVYRVAIRVLDQHRPSGILNSSHLSHDSLCLRLPVKPPPFLNQLILLPQELRHLFLLISRFRLRLSNGNRSPSRSPALNTSRSNGTGGRGSRRSSAASGTLRAHGDILLESCGEGSVCHDG